MKDLIEVENEEITSKIYEIRGVQVMLASVIAKLYNVETKALNQAIKRNITRFPESFCFQLTKKEFMILRSQFVTSRLISEIYHGGVRYLPYVLTEQGIMMLSGLLKSDIAARVNVEIIEAFVSIRKYISNTLVNQNFINELVYKHDRELISIKESLKFFKENTKINAIFYEGQIYDAYSLLLDILNKAKKEIIIIDNYAGKELLDILKKVNKKNIIISKNIDEVLVKKYKAQYSNIGFKKIDVFHDRFIIIDRKILYNCGSSFKDLGKKCFAINEMESKETLNTLIDKVIND